MTMLHDTANHKLKIQKTRIVSCCNKKRSKHGTSYLESHIHVHYITMVWLNASHIEQKEHFRHYSNGQYSRNTVTKLKLSIFCSWIKLAFLCVVGWSGWQGVVDNPINVKTPTNVRICKANIYKNGFHKYENKVKYFPIFANFWELFNTLPSCQNFYNFGTNCDYFSLLLDHFKNTITTIFAKTLTTYVSPLYIALTTYVSPLYIAFHWRTE